MEIRFNGIIQKNNELNIFFIAIPYNIREVFGKRSLDVKATFDGREYDGLIEKIGNYRYSIKLPYSAMWKSKKDVGDSMTVTICADRTENKKK